MAFKRSAVRSRLSPPYYISEQASFSVERCLFIFSRKFLWERGITIENTVRILLVEDSEIEKQNFVNALKPVDDIELIGITASAKTAQNLILEKRPDVVVLDMELADGNGLELSHTISKLKPQIRPYVVVTTVISSPVVHKALHSYGVGYIFVKEMYNYSPNMVISHIKLVKNYIRNFSPVELETCTKKQEHGMEFSKKLSENEIKNIIRQKLTKIGITEKLLGFGCLTELIYNIKDARYIPDLVTDVYPAIAEKFMTRPENIERNIRNAIEKAWRETDDEILNDVYPCAVSPERGKPTIKEFVCCLAGQIKNL